MPKYLVRVDVTYSTTVIADDEDDAIEKAPDLPGDPANTSWSRCKPEWEAVESK